MTANIAASIRGRLRNKARPDGTDFQLLLVRYACERFLYRLGVSEERYILKGATLLAVWMEDPYRATRDIDLLATGEDDEEAVRRVMTTICNVPCLEDGLVFDLDTLRVSSIREDQKYGGQRARVVALLGETRTTVQVDFGFGDIVTHATQKDRLPTLLEDIPAPVLHVYPQVTAVAEKFEAMVRFGTINNRMKDFHDIWVLSESFAFNGADLREAVARCFDRRGTHLPDEMPEALTIAFYADAARQEQWQAYGQQGGLFNAPPDDFQEIGSRVQSFLGPVYASIRAEEPCGLHWPAAGPWQAQFKPYPAYKPSGADRLGDIPTHWDVRRLKYLATVNDETLPENTDRGLEIAYVDIGNVDSVKGITGMEHLVFEDAPSRARRIVRQGDVIISTVRTYLKAIARIESMSTNLIVSTGFAVIRPRHSHDGFIAYALSSPYFVERVVAHSVGVSYPAINASELACLDVGFPSISEQCAIAAFLDRETAKIDALVSKKERLVELLQEKGTALISHTVTKGLDPNVTMKESGVEWLGKIPAHWEVKRLKHLAKKIGSGKTPKGGAERYVDDGVMLLRSQNVHFGELQLTDVAYIDIETDNEMPGSRVREGDVLLNITGASLGRTCIARLGGKDANVNQHVCIIRTDQQQDDSEFLAYSIESQSLQDQIFNNENGVSRDALNFEQIGDLVFARAAIVEQEIIVSFLDQETAKLDTLIAKVQKAIELLKELRTALISAAVTGKVDVREEA